MCIIFLLTVLNMKPEIQLDMYNMPSVYFFICVSIYVFVSMEFCSLLTFWL